MKLTVRQLIALEQALNVGTTIDINGTKYTFHHLTFGDMAQHMAWRKDRRLAAYLRAIQSGGVDISPADRFRDMHDIMMCGARLEDFAPGDPENRIHLTWLSLKHAHPEISEEQVDVLISDDNAREVIADVLKIKNAGPMTNEELDDHGADPTKEATSPEAESP